MALINVTWNPLDFNGGHTLSNNNLTDTVISTGNDGNIRATHGKSEGKWYWEVKYVSGSRAFTIGVASKNYPIKSSSISGTSGDAILLRGFYGFNGVKYPESSTYTTALAVGDVIGIALDMDLGTLEFYKNGASLGVSHTNVKLLGEVFPFIKHMDTVTTVLTANFGASQFTHPIPNGYEAYSIMTFNKFLILKNDEYYEVIDGNYSENSIPKMTSNTTPSGIARSSSVEPTFNAYNAFDKEYSPSNNNSVFLFTRGTTTGWLSYEFTTPKKIEKYSVRSQNVTRSLKNWTFEGSNDGLTWDVLDVRANEINWLNAERRSYTFINENYYKFYRINITSNNGDTNYTAIEELEMFEKLPSSILVLNSPISEQNFITHGMDKSTVIDLNSQITKKVFIEQDAAVLGSGKVFSKTIDTTKTPIKKVSIN